LFLRGRMYKEETWIMEKVPSRSGLCKGRERIVVLEKRVRFFKCRPVQLVGRLKKYSSLKSIFPFYIIKKCHL
jgi:hypothetical protein